jgi:hypothetical protein
MRVRAGFEKDDRLAQVAHDLRDERMDDRRVGHHHGHVGGGGSGGEGAAARTVRRMGHSL